jgi:hypothetical protein
MYSMSATKNDVGFTMMRWIDLVRKIIETEHRHYKRALLKKYSIQQSGLWETISIELYLCYSENHYVFFFLFFSPRCRTDDQYDIHTYISFFFLSLIFKSPVWCIQGYFVSSLLVFSWFVLYIVWTFGKYSCCFDFD